MEKTALISNNSQHEKVRVEISAVLVPVSKERALSRFFADNDAKIVYGEIYVWDDKNNPLTQRLVRDVMANVRSVYQQEAELALHQERGFPLSSSRCGK